MLEKNYKVGVEAIQTIDQVPIQEQEEIVQYSLKDYFYKENQTLSLSCELESVVGIYYTMDGTSPDSKQGILYEDPILLTGTGLSTLHVKSYSILSCAKLEDGTFTKVQFHTYFIGEKVDERFDCLVVSLTTAPDGLYNYEDGIFVEGKLRDEYMEETGDTNPDPDKPANYNVRGMEAEREVNVEVLESDGTCVIHQKAGMRVAGGWSRGNAQKSIKLIARSSYDEKLGSFDYEFFPEAKTFDHRDIVSYKRLVLRNNANDWPFAFLRDEAISVCADDTPLLDVQYSRPVAVYLNGEYYGFAWLHSVYDNDYFNAMNGNYEELGEWQVIDSGERWFSADSESETMIEQDMKLKYANVLSYAKYDLTNDEIYEELEQMVDITNFLWYYAIEAYIGNTDWPNNNNKIYRYYSEEELSLLGVEEGTKNQGTVTALQQKEDSGNQDQISMDGKIRWLFFDSDFGLGIYNHPYYEETLVRLIDPESEDCSNLLIALLKREDIQKRFVTIFCDIMNQAFSPKSVKEAIEQKEDDRIAELTHDFSFGSALPDTWGSMEYTENEVDVAIQYAALRPAAFKMQLNEAFEGLGSEYEVTAVRNSHATIHVNGCSIEPEEKAFTGTYYSVCPLTLSADVEEEYQFVQWVVNGMQYEEEQVTLDVQDLDVDSISVELEVEKITQSRIPIIREIWYRDQNDRIVLYNPYETAIQLKNLFLSDDGEDLQKSMVSAITIQPESEVTIYCDSYQGLEALGQYYVEFNLKRGEILYLSDVNGEILQEIYLGDIRKESHLEYNMKVKVFEEVANEAYD